MNVTAKVTTAKVGVTGVPRDLEERISSLKGARVLYQVAPDGSGSNYRTDIAPLLKMNVPEIWVNRHGEKLEGRKAPAATVKNLRDAAKKLGAS